MSLVKSPVLTAAKLAANRANARKSTGPRSDAGRSRVALNALRHGRWASSKSFRIHLALVQEELALYNWIYLEICVALKPATEAEWQRMARLARQTWCFLVRRPVRSPVGWPAGWPTLRPGQWPAGCPIRRPPTRSSVWCLFSVPKRLGGRPKYAVKASLGRVLGASSYWLQLNESTYLKFWVRRRRQPADRRTDSAASTARRARKPASGRFGRLLGTLWNKATMFLRNSRCERYAPKFMRPAGGQPDAEERPEGIRREVRLGDQGVRFHSNAGVVRTEPYGTGMGSDGPGQTKDPTDPDDLCLTRAL